MNIIQDKAKLTALVASIGKASVKLDETIHVALVSLLVHIRDHGDTTLLTRLFAALPRGSRLQSYFLWCEMFAPVKVNRKKDQFGQASVKKGHTPDQFNILEAMAIAPWDLVSHNKEAKALEFDALIKLVTRHARKSIDAGKLTIEQVRGLSDRVAADLVTIQA